MHYVCIENKEITAVLDYAPSVPSTVTVVEIDDVAYANITAGTHTFNVKTLKVEPVSALVALEKTKERQKMEGLVYLNTSDWQVLRHIREKALGLPTSLSEQEYISLEQQRNQTAKNI